MIAKPVKNEIRDWSDNTGLYKVRGKVSVITATHVRLLKENGRYSTVPLRRLSASDYRHVMALKASFGDDDSLNKIAAN